MNRAEFIVCSLAFHAALLVLAVILPAPFPSQKAYTLTDTAYVEVERRAADSARDEAEDTEKAGGLHGASGLNPDILGRLAINIPESLSLDEGFSRMGERIRAAASAGLPAAAGKAAPAAKPAPRPSAARPPAGPPPAAEPPQEKAAPDETASAPEPKDAGPEPGAGTAAGPEPGLTAYAAMDEPVGRVTTARKSLNFKYQVGWPAPAMIGVQIDADGPGEGRSWTAEADRDWIIVSPGKGSGSGRIEVGVLANALEVGYHEGAVRLGDTGSGTGDSGLAVTLMVLPEDPGIPELPHFAWDDYMDGGCQVCHLPKEVMPSGDFMERPEFCGLCHNPAGMASGSGPAPGGHPVMVNVTSGGARMPTGGTVEAGAYSDMMSTHLLGGDRVVCVTCHNVMYKPGDYGRTWELASTDDGMVYRLSRGGWSQMGWLIPKAYVTKKLTQFPDRLSGLKAFMVKPSVYEYDEAEGLIRFNKTPGEGTFVYVTLSNPYLRAPTANSAMCYDCHSENTHQGMNCLACHAAHGTANIMAVRESVRTPGGKPMRVVFISYSGEGSFVSGAPDRPGICRACHTATSVYASDGGNTLHADGRDYTGSDCTRCHSHDAGFSAVQPGPAAPEDNETHVRTASH